MYKSPGCEDLVHMAFILLFDFHITLNFIPSSPLLDFLWRLKAHISLHFIPPEVDGAAGQSKSNI